MKCEKLEARERFVVAQVDEIYVKGKIDFKNGKIPIWFCIKSSGANICKNNCNPLDFIRLRRFQRGCCIESCSSVVNLTADDLLKIVKDTCSLVTEWVFKVVIISDNNKVNHLLFQLLCILQKCEFSLWILFLCSLNTFLIFLNCRFWNLRKSW